jgi:hypothetical protein
VQFIMVIIIDTAERARFLARGALVFLGIVLPMFLRADCLIPSAILLPMFLRADCLIPSAILLPMFLRVILPTGL